MKKYIVLFLFLILMKNNLLANDYDIRKSDIFIDNSNVKEEFLKNNTVFYSYKDNENKNVEFSLLLPKTAKGEVNKIKNINDYYNKEPILVSNFIINKKVKSSVYLLNSSKEFSLFDLAKGICIGKCGECKYLFENNFSDMDIDILFETKNKEFVRVKVLRNGNFYYLYSFFIKDKDELLKMAGEISLSIDSFKLLNPIKEFTKKFQYVEISKPIKVAFALPFGYKYKNTTDKYLRVLPNKEDKFDRIDITNDKHDNLQVFVVNENKNLKQKDFLAYYLTYLKFFKIEIGSIKNDFVILKNDDIILKTKCKIENRDFELYVIVKEIDKFIVLVSVFNIPQEINYLRYIENKEVLNIILQSLNFS